MKLDFFFSSLLIQISRRGSRNRLKSWRVMVETLKAKGLWLCAVFRIQTDRLQNLKRKSYLFSDFPKEFKVITCPRKVLRRHKSATSWRLAVLGKKLDQAQRKERENEEDLNKVVALVSVWCRRQKNDRSWKADCVGDIWALLWPQRSAKFVFHVKIEPVIRNLSKKT